MILNYPSMTAITSWLLESLKNQGLSFLLLGVAVFYLQDKNDTMAAEIRQCQEQRYNALVEVIQANTKALEKLSYGKEEKER